MKRNTSDSIQVPEQVGVTHWRRRFPWWCQPILKKLCPALLWSWKTPVIFIITLYLHVHGNTDYYSNNCALIISISHNLHDIQRPFTLQEFHVKFLCAFYDEFLSYAIFKWNEKLLHLQSYMKLTSISLENDISLLFYHDFFSCINIQLYTNNIQLSFNAHNW